MRNVAARQLFLLARTFVFCGATACRRLGMNVRDVIHRLRLRANNARAAGEYALAQDLHAAIDRLIRWRRSLRWRGRSAFRLRQND